ncbi:hypothetical protein AVEN_49968-1 [Araneus ventricosus]|uniref:Uncharacterized protein n=1 Tax=Araneus ventricosus TaxID=182803 RepID=A0A4Y2EZY5_ARAVE|nr:hypothetical protein AVEN_41242-1 [Araneus ventricosus]GBM34107.1 hypothetical protein AVEN_49968-1 [Araneus ventricosus]
MSLSGIMTTYVTQFTSAQQYSQACLHDIPAYIGAYTLTSRSQAAGSQEWTVFLVRREANIVGSSWNTNGCAAHVRTCSNVVRLSPQISNEPMIESVNQGVSNHRCLVHSPSDVSNRCNNSSAEAGVLMVVTGRGPTPSERGMRSRSPWWVQ